MNNIKLEQIKEIITAADIHLTFAKNMLADERENNRIEQIIDNLRAASDEIRKATDNLIDIYPPIPFKRKHI